MKFTFIKKYVLLAALVAMVFLQSCKNDPEPTVQIGEAGFFVVNEGAFGGNNASISFYDQKTETMSNDIYVKKNGAGLGDQAQSMTLFEGKAYVVLQGSHIIRVINPDDFSSITTITSDDGIVSPRYLVGISTTKAYVSDWGSDGLTGTVKVLDLSTNKITKTIATGQGANRMLKIGNLVYVTNAGGYGYDNTIKIIDSNTDEVVNTIEVADNPNALLQDNNGNIWVTCGGAIAYNDDYSINEPNSTKGALCKITSDNKISLKLLVDKVTNSSPNNLCISPDGLQLYYTYDGAVYSMSSSSTTLPTTAFKNKDYYGLSVNPYNGNIIGGEVPSFGAAGSIDMYNAAGTLLKTFEVGIGPNSCTFK